MNVLIIGGSGMFGRKTALHLLQDPDISTVISMDLTPPVDWFLKAIDRYKDRFSFVKGDVSQLEDILDKIKLYSVDRIIHWAVVMGAAANTMPRLATKVNMLGTCNVFEAVRLMGVNRIVYASSRNVYGNPQDVYGDREVTEDDQINLNNPYGLAKRYAEILAEQYSEQFGIKSTGVRPAIGYGHDGRTPIQYWSDMPSFVAVGKPYFFEMNGTEPESLVAADDLGEFAKLLIKASSSPNPIYNIGGPPVTMQDLARVIRTYIADADITFGDKESPFGKRGRILYRYSMARAIKDFGFSCMPMEQAVLIHINDARQAAGLEPIKA
jgi:nucleoside-diphosphate-sugar epimerase